MLTSGFVDSCASFKRRALLSVSATALIMASSAAANAQTAPVQTGQVEEVVVTGSRVVRDGYQAPAPLTVIGVEDIQAMAPANIHDYLRVLPSMAGTSSSHQGGGGISSANKGLNTLNLRGLGANRNLVLVDGARHPPAGLDGVTDVGQIPDALIERVDVVTGGASAAYGSDAVSGVINFVLDKDFTGVKGLVQGGVTTYGDDRNFNVSLTAGTTFANDRGHFIASGSYSKVDGIHSPTGTEGTPRDWARRSVLAVTNPAYTPTNGLPNQIIAERASPTLEAPGGIVVSGPLKGLAFGAGGTPFQFNYGTLSGNGQHHIGGDYMWTSAGTLTALDMPASRRNMYTRISYDITDNVNIWATWSYGDTLTQYYSDWAFFQGNQVAKADNAFMPESVRSRMVALGLTQLNMGTSTRDLGVSLHVGNRASSRYIVGLNGNFDAFGTNWNWDFYAQRGFTRHDNYIPNSIILQRFRDSIDSVRSPTTGAIVCRTTLTNANNGCVPFNIFGVGVNNLNQIGPWVFGKSELHQNFLQDVQAVSIRGEPFEIWAGPVSWAMGIENRRERVKGYSDPLSQSVTTNNYHVGNYKPTFGSFNVTEGFAETVIPLAKDEAWAQSLDLNGAVRATKYSVQGFETTWKVGATYQPITDIRFRAYRSRDIRAPNLFDLFNAGQQVVNTFIDRFRKNPDGSDIITQAQQNTTGNLALTSEKADSTGIGVVLQPTFLPGFNFSADWYNVKVKNAISTYIGQDIIDRCFAGITTFCDGIVRNAAGAISIIKGQPFNAAALHTRGIEFESSYQFALDDVVSGWGGNVTLRALATHVSTLAINDGRATTELAGQNSGLNALPATPSWRYMVAATYEHEAFRGTLTARGIDSGVINSNAIQCTSGCPATTALNPTVADNRAPGFTYFDLALAYKVVRTDESEVELFFNVQNLANKDPAIVNVAVNGTQYLQMNVNPQLYDTLGRQFKAGVRFKM